MPFYKSKPGLNRSIDHLVNKPKTNNADLLAIAVACVIGALCLLVYIGQVKAGVL